LTNYTAPVTLLLIGEQFVQWSVFTNSSATEELLMV